MDALQTINMFLYVAILALAVHRKCYKMPFLPLFILVAHMTVFYVVVFARDYYNLNIPYMMVWSAATRLGLAITILVYLIFWSNLWPRNRC